jgi:hypothetical protein
MFELFLITPTAQRSSLVGCPRVLHAKWIRVEKLHQWGRLWIILGKYSLQCKTIQGHTYLMSHRTHIPTAIWTCNWHEAQLPSCFCSRQIVCFVFSFTVTNTDGKICTWAADFSIRHPFKKSYKQCKRFLRKYRGIQVSDLSTIFESVKQVRVHLGVS